MVPLKSTRVKVMDELPWGSAVTVLLRVKKMQLV